MGKSKEDTERGASELCDFEHAVTVGVRCACVSAFI